VDGHRSRDRRSLKGTETSACERLTRRRMLSISFPTSDALDGATSWVASFTSTNSLHEVVINGFRALQAALARRHP
jgi:hypothetical protein